VINQEERERPEVSVLIPTLDEEKSIGSCISKIKSIFLNNNISGEIIVSDSSSDRTPEIAVSLGAAVIFPPHMGYGNAYIAAIDHAKGKYIVFGDGDDTYDFEELPLLLEPLKNGADLVMGSRFLGTIERGAMTPLHHYIGNPILTWVFNKVFSCSYSDVHSGFRVIKSEKLRELNIIASGMEYATAMLVAAQQKNLKVVEVPIHYYLRKSPSKLHSFADGWRHMRYILLVRPTSLLGVPGFLIFLLGSVIIAFFYLDGNFTFSRFHSFILGSLFLIVGVQIILMNVMIKVYSVIHGYEKKEGWVSLVMNYHSLEKLIVAGGALLILGLLIGFYIIVSWTTKNFGSINLLNDAILSMTLVALGILVIFSSVFISMMLLNEKD